MSTPTPQAISALLKRAGFPRELHLTPRQRGRLGALADGLVRDLAQALGRGEHDARAAAIAVLMRQRADEAAYERVAESRGLLSP
jgi:Spy/CpxP family protein refolding chaperone